MSTDELVFLPLGGCREIGMNLNAYGYGPPGRRRWLIVDVGVTFADARLPGIDLIMPDPSWLEGQTIDGIVLTHAHEDHIGAIGHIWDRIEAPIYLSAFANQILLSKFAEAAPNDDPTVHVIRAGEKVCIGPFSVTFVPLTHSIPEMNALHIECRAGTVFHTGDWKIDTGPMVGDTVDEARLRAIGDMGVDAMVCDSTNVFEEGEAGSEASVSDALTRLVAEQTGVVVIACFASNVARLSSACAAAKNAGRAVMLAGRSMFRIVDAAKAAGYLKGVAFLNADQARSVPADRILYLCTGSQGEPRAALARVARGDHPDISLGEGDCVIFSSRVIPGNEVAIAELQNALSEQGVALITERSEPVHVSGHPCRDELRRMYGWIRPKLAVPVHGERRHCREHARFAEKMGIAAIAPDNGELVRIAPEPDVIDRAPVGRMVLDGKVLMPGGGAGLVERTRLGVSGQISVAVAVDVRGRVIDGPLVAARGLSEADGSAADESLDVLSDAAVRAVERLRPAAMEQDDSVERALVKAVRSACFSHFGKRPLIDVHVLRV